MLILVHSYSVSDLNWISKIKKGFTSKFDIKDLEIKSLKGGINHCLGIDFTQTSGKITISQKVYIEELSF